MREQAEQAPNAHNTAETALGVRRLSLPHPVEFSKMLMGMTICQSFELGLNLLNEVGSALYVLHKYNSAVVDNFDGDEFFGAERKLDMKERMRDWVKEVQKLSADAKKAVGATGGPAFSTGRGRGRRSLRRTSRGGAAHGGDRSFPLGFVMPVVNAPGYQLRARRDAICLKCNEKEHFARDCPNK